MVGFLAALAIAVITQVVAMVLMPRPKQPKPDAAKQLDDPVAEAGMIIPLVMGRMTVTQLNVLDFRDKSIKNYKVKV